MSPRRDRDVRDGPGKRANGALEAEVLGVLWAAQRPLTPAEVRQALDEGGVADLAYTTVATTLSRLLAKGQLRREAAGRGHAYAPTRGAAQRAAELMRGILDDVAGTGVDHGDVLQHFLAGLDSADVAAARVLLAGPPDAPPASPRRRVRR